MTSLFLGIVLVSTCGATAVFYHLFPQLSRPDVFFGVTVNPGIREEPVGRKVLARYRRQIWLNFAIAAALAVAGASFGTAALLFAGTTR
jgi:hypothetical protein